VNVVLCEERTSPFDLVLDTLPLGLGCRPEFEVLDTVVIADAVEVMDVLVGKEVAPEMLLHDDLVLADLLPGGGLENAVSVLVDSSRSAWGHEKDQRVAVALPPLVVQGAPPARHVGSLAALDSAERVMLPVGTERRFRIAVAPESLVVGVAPAALALGAIAALDGTEIHHGLKYTPIAAVEGNGPSDGMITAVTSMLSAIIGGLIGYSAAKVSDKEDRDV